MPKHFPRTRVLEVPPQWGISCDQAPMFPYAAGGQIVVLSSATRKLDFQAERLTERSASVCGYASRAQARCRRHTRHANATFIVADGRRVGDQVADAFQQLVTLGCHLYAFHFRRLRSSQPTSERVSRSIAPLAVHQAQALSHRTFARV